MLQEEIPSGTTFGTNLASHSVSAASSVSLTSGGLPAQLSPAELVAILNIPGHLTDKDDTSLKAYYQKYKACLQAQHTVDDMTSKGQWPAQRKPNLTDVVKLFVSPSMWHSHVKKLARVPDYPMMQEWLEGGEGAPDDLTVWGYTKQNGYNFMDLKGYFEKQDEKAASKGKKKQQKGADDDGGSKQKKGNKKSKK